MTREVELEHQGQISEAEQVLVTDLRNTEIAAAGSIEHALVLNNLGVLYMAADRHLDAVRSLRRAIRIVEALEGDAVKQILAKTKVHLAAC